MRWEFLNVGGGLYAMPPLKYKKPVQRHEDKKIHKVIIYEYIAYIKCDPSQVERDIEA